jgi:uncharacterized membrane protein
MSLILRSFFQGLLFVVPVAATVTILYWVFVRLDSLVDTEAWLGSSIPGLGLALLLVAITLIGLVGSSFVARWFVRLVERLFERLPLVKLIYGAIKDVLDAFVGDSRKFDTPVLVSLGDELGGELLGFVTRRELAWIGREGSAAVYFPQSYNFAGNVVLFPRERLTAVDAEPSQVMQFIVSGGISGGAKAEAPAS